MSDLRAQIREALRSYELDWTYDNKDLYDELAGVVLSLPGVVVVELPGPQPGWWDCYEDEGDEPDHDSYGDQSGEFVVTTWRGHPGEVQISHQGEPLEPVRPTEARALAAALLAAANAAEAVGNG